MKLGVDIRCLQDRHWTGVALYTRNILKQFTVILGQDLEIGLFANALKLTWGGKVDDLGLIACSHLPNSLLNSLWQVNLGPALDTILTKHNFKPRIVWLPNLHFFKLSPQVIKAVTIHDLSFIHFPQFFSWKKRVWYLNYITKQVRYGLKDFSLILTISQHTADDFSNLRPDLAKRVVAIKLGVNKEFFISQNPTQIQAVKAKFNLPDNYLLTVGTLEPRKNHLLLLKVFEELCRQDNSLSLVIAGVRGWQWKPIINFWQKMVYKDKVHFIGYVAHSDKAALYAGAQLFLYPSFYEGFGFPPLEAMACGVPTLVSSVSSLPEVVQDGAVLLDPWIPDEWLYTIRYILDNKDYASKLAKRGQDVARGYSWADTANKILTEFNKL